MFLDYNALGLCIEIRIIMGFNLVEYMRFVSQRLNIQFVPNLGNSVIMISLVLQEDLKVALLGIVSSSYFNMCTIEPYGNELINNDFTYTLRYIMKT